VNNFPVPCFLCFSPFFSCAVLTCPVVSFQRRGCFGYRQFAAGPYHVVFRFSIQRLFAAFDLFHFYADTFGAIFRLPPPSYWCSHTFSPRVFISPYTLVTFYDCLHFKLLPSPHILCHPPPVLRPFRGDPPSVWLLWSYQCLGIFFEPTLQVWRCTFTRFESCRSWVHPLTSVKNNLLPKFLFYGIFKRAPNSRFLYSSGGVRWAPNPLFPLSWLLIRNTSFYPTHFPLSPLFFHLLFSSSPPTPPLCVLGILGFTHGLFLSQSVALVASFFDLFSPVAFFLFSSSPFTQVFSQDIVFDPPPPPF